MIEIIDNFWVYSFALGIFCIALGVGITIITAWFCEWRKDSPKDRRKQYFMLKYWCPDCGYIFHVPERVDEGYPMGSKACPYCKLENITLEDENVEVWV